MKRIVIVSGMAIGLLIMGIRDADTAQKKAKMTSAAEVKEFDVSASKLPPAKTLEPSI